MNQTLQWVLGIVIALQVAALGAMWSQLNALETRVSRSEGINDERLRQLDRIEASLVRIQQGIAR